MASPAPVPGLRSPHGHLLGADLFHPLDPARPGSFGRMFTGLPALTLTEAQAQALANAMIETPGLGADNTVVPAGFTYLGQFVDHDITLDLTPLGQPAPNPSAIPNHRTPRLDLDSVYLGGPASDPNLYEADGVHLRIGTTSGAPHANDLPRNGSKAIIGDARNDENLVVAQLHLQFLKAHNKLADQGRTFDQARTTLRHHYQFILLTEFLPAICGQAVVDDVLTNGRQFYRPTQNNLFMPVEFSGAAYRFGHSMVRETYNYNRVFPTATLGQLFQFTGGGIAPIPDIWMADWRRFFALDIATPPNPARAVDPFLAPALANLPGFPPGENILARRNLIRGSSLGLPSGQAVASVLGVPQLTASEVASGPDGAVAASLGLHTQTPLWYYLLKEASIATGGRSLGPAGARIVAETFIGLLQFTPNSIINAIPRPVITLPHATANQFTCADLLRFVDDINPLN